MKTQTAGVYLMTADQRDAFVTLASDRDVRDVLALTDETVASIDTFMSEQRDATEHRRSYAFVISDRGIAQGVAWIGAINDGTARDLRVATRAVARRKGYATLAVKMVLEFAFRNLQLKRVDVSSNSGADCLGVLKRNGFIVNGDRAVIAPETWREFLDRPALNNLHAPLRVLLDVELASGNAILESGTGWPDDDSVFIRLRDPFRAKPAMLPEGVTYTELNDPHWWKADYSSRAPRHILAC